MQKVPNLAIKNLLRTFALASNETGEESKLCVNEGIFILPKGDIYHKNQKAQESVSPNLDSWASIFLTKLGNEQKLTI